MNTQQTNGRAPGGPPAAPANAPAVVQVNPMYAAQLALTYMARADIKPGERESYGIAEALMQAIASGQVILAPPAAPEVAELGEVEAPPA